MSENESQAPGLNFAPADIYHVLFRHKWKILFFSLIGLVVAGFIYVREPVYVSQAKLLVKYVAERRSGAGMPMQEGEQVIRSLELRGDALLNTEAELLTSRDLAVKVAEAVGPERILAGVGGGTNLDQAVGMIRKGLRIEPAKNTGIMVVSYEHPDTTMVVPVLSRLIEEYFIMHRQIHLPGANFQELDERTSALRKSLEKTEEELRTIKNTNNILSLEDSRTAITAEMAAIRQMVRGIESVLAERRASPQLAGSNSPAAKSNATETVAATSPELVEQYKALSVRLNGLRNAEDSMLRTLTEENPRVVAVRKQITEAEKKKKEMLEADPGLAATDIPAPTADGRSAGPGIEMIPTPVLEARLKALGEQQEKLKKEAEAFEDAESKIIKLQRQKDIDEKKYLYFSAALEQARTDSTIDASKMTSITKAQEPTPPYRDTSKVMKPAALALAAGVFGGLALAFLLEFFLDQSVKRPGEVEGSLQLPLAMSIPRQNRRAKGIRPKRRTDQEQAAKDGAASNVSASGKFSGIAPWDPQHVLRPFCEALRDRILLNFEGVNRRPKLVGVTSCGEGSGVTTLAAGLASALSETGQGKVLLVDMSCSNGAAHPFLRGQPACALSEALEDSKSQGALLQENLVLASTNRVAADTHPVLARTLLEVMPKLKGSDYDYVVFDLPPVTQTSITFRVAGYMDKVFLLLESEKTQKPLVKKVCSLLAQAKAHPDAILNKYRRYVPQRFQQEL